MQSQQRLRQHPPTCKLHSQLSPLTVIGKVILVDLIHRNYRQSEAYDTMHGSVDHLSQTSSCYDQRTSDVNGTDGPPLHDSVVASDWR